MNDQSSYISNFDQQHQDTPSIERYGQRFMVQGEAPYTQDTPSYHQPSGAMIYHQRFQDIVDDLTSTRLLPNNLYSMGSQRTNQEVNNTLRAPSIPSQRIFVEYPSQMPTEVVSRRAESTKIYIEGENMQVLNKPPKVQSLITEMEQILTLRDS